jgi:hypothetical protein
MACDSNIHAFGKDRKAAAVSSSHNACQQSSSCVVSCGCIEPAKTSRATENADLIFTMQGALAGIMVECRSQVSSLVYHTVSALISPPCGRESR